jgi:hypothetical protein
MRTLTTFSAVIVLMAMSSSALAQGQRQKTYKRSCQEVCLERCKAKGPVVRTFRTVSQAILESI